MSRISCSHARLDGGARWPSDVRSVSVGDVLCVHTPDGDEYVAVAGYGYDAIPVPDAAHIVPLAGTAATSRKEGMS